MKKVVYNVAYHDLGNIEERLVEATIKMGAADGVSNVTCRKLASVCNITSGTIFHRFNTMQALLDTAAQAFDQPYMAQVVQMANDNLTAEQIWDIMLDSFVGNPDGTLYYISYTNTFGFDPTSHNPRAAEFLPIAQVFFRSAKPLSDEEYLILWDYITSMAFYYAEKFLHGFLPYDATTKAFVKRVVFDGMTHILG